MGNKNASCTDTGHDTELEFLDETEELEPFRSPSDRLLLFADTAAFEGAEEFSYNLLSHSATILKRVFRATM